jgi:hypothetical protein
MGFLSEYTEKCPEPDFLPLVLGLVRGASGAPQLMTASNPVACRRYGEGRGASRERSGRLGDFSEVLRDIGDVLRRDVRVIRQI